MIPEINIYNQNKTPDRQEICERLYQEIFAGLPEAENKLWHGAPAWFLASNPIVGYHSLKNGVRLFFWSGQSFNESGLKDEGTFKAAGIMYNGLGEINSDDIQRWLQKAQVIQWDYKNLIKNGRLIKIANP